jgi:hypothetical protein
VALSLSLSLSRDALKMIYNVLANSAAKQPHGGMWLEEGSDFDVNIMVYMYLPTVHHSIGKILIFSRAFAPRFYFILLILGLPSFLCF